MKELLYFSFSDLMVRVEYAPEANSLRYAAHREVTFGERVIVEQYLLTTVAPKTEYYKRQPAIFVYIGVDVQLKKELNLFHLKNTLKHLAGKEKEVNEKVSALINEAMTNYYFEKIGDTLLALKDSVRSRAACSLTEEERSKIMTLVSAYNTYSPRKIDAEELLTKAFRDLSGRPLAGQALAGQAGEGAPMKVEKSF